MVIRYRKLKRSFDLAEYRKLVTHSWDMSTRPGRRNDYRVPDWSDVATHGEDGLLEALISAPRKVEASDHHGTLPEVLALVRAGTLGFSDLVDVGRGWETVGECFELAEATEPLALRRRRTRRVLLASVGAGLLLLCVLLVAL